MGILSLTNLYDKGIIKVDIDVEPRFEQIIKQAQTSQFKLVKKNSDSQWYDLNSFNYSLENKHYEYKDILVENNVKYQYSIKLVNSSFTDNIEEQTITPSIRGNWLCDKNNSISVSCNLDNASRPQLLARYSGRNELRLIESFVTNNNPKILKSNIFGLMMVAILEITNHSDGIGGVFRLGCIEVGDAYDNFTLINNGLL